MLSDSYFRKLPFDSEVSFQCMLCYVWRNKLDFLLCIDVYFVRPYGLYWLYPSSVEQLLSRSRQLRNWRTRPSNSLYSQTKTFIQSKFPWSLNSSLPLLDPISFSETYRYTDNQPHQNFYRGRIKPLLNSLSHRPNVYTSRLYQTDPFSWSHTVSVTDSWFSRTQ